jgi:hypothetical protein
MSLKDYTQRLAEDMRRALDAGSKRKDKSSGKRGKK